MRTSLPFASISTLARIGIVFFAFNDALEKLQFSQKLVLPDYEFHRRAVTSKRSGWSAVKEPLSQVLTSLN